VNRHRPTEARSRNYNALILAEEAAVRQFKGMFSKKEKTSSKILDLTIRRRRGEKATVSEVANNESASDLVAAAPKHDEVKVTPQLGRDGKPRRPPANANSKARALLPSLQRKGQINGVVEHVYTGSRMKIYLPSDNCFISLMLAGIRSPEYNSDGDENQLSNVVTKYNSTKLLQRSVKVNINSIDQRDNFIGGVWIQKTNFAVHLATKGYASVNDYSAGKTEYKKQLVAAQSKAQAAKIGMWENWVKPPTPVQSENEKPECYAFKRGECKRSNCRFSHGAEADAAAAEAEKIDTTTRNGEEFMNVVITEINDAANFYVTTVGDKNVETVNAAMTEFTASVTDAPEDFEVVTGQVYAGLFSDNAWYRVRIEGKSKDGSFRVIFLDYGNRTELKQAQLRPLPKSVSSVLPLARQCSLAGCVSSFRSEYKDESTEEFARSCFQQEFSARVDLRDKSNKLHLSLMEEDSKQTINERLVAAGLLRVVERPERGLKDGLLKTLRAAEQTARESFLGVWEYGDVSDSDGEADDSKNARSGKAPRRKDFNSKAKISA
jgi:staphylococcal nuclease domain-containing protein 1